MVRRRYTAKKKGRKYTELERLSYNLGQVSRGLKNPNSRVYESFNNGKTGKTTSHKKPLI